MSYKNICLHSMFRCGSTYFFEKFRSSKYTCFQEPLNESLTSFNKDILSIYQNDSNNYKKLRHPELSNPYFFEYKPIINKLGANLDESLCYRRFFDTSDNDRKLSKYINILQESSKEKKFFQFCRTWGRLDLFSNFINIFLWRN